ncbi:MAG TPA: DUF4214 domain-containing protein [Streptosporangiaceae bacterium]
MSTWSRLRVLAAISLIVATFVIALAGVPSPAAAATVVPSQWIAKIYTEGLGRAPDQAAWANMVGFFQSNGCSATTLAQKGEPIYNSSEFDGLGYDNAARLLALYRGALGREPDSSGYTHYLGLLQNQTPWSTVVTDLFTSPEFTSDAATFCTEGSYNFGAGPAIAIPLGQSCTGQFCFTGGTQTQLQTMLDNAEATHATVTLTQQVVVSISNPPITVGPPRQRPVGLDIPAGVTLTTAGQPSPNEYAEMGRLVRGSSFGTGTTGAAVVEVESGAKLLNVWVDGQRTGPTDHQGETVNVETAGGSGTIVSSDRLSNAIGFTNLHALGTAESLPCSSNTITGNLVTAYSSSHTNGDWSDGLSVACENATVEHNTVIDATDVPIVLFRAYPADQKSIVADNTILNAGNPAFGGIVADPLSTPIGQQTVSPSFAGASVQSNTLWTGPGAYYHIGLSVGSAAWFGSQKTGNPNIGSGASFTSNTLTASATEAIAVSGMLNATVTGNTLNWTPGQFGHCPPRVEIAVDPQYGSGTIQSPVTSVDVRDCIS